MIMSKAQKGSKPKPIILKNVVGIPTSLKLEPKACINSGTGAFFEIEVPIKMNAELWVEDDGIR